MSGETPFQDYLLLYLKFSVCECLMETLRLAGHEELEVQYLESAGHCLESVLHCLESELEDLEEGGVESILWHQDLEYCSHLILQM